MCDQVLNGFLYSFNTCKAFKNILIVMLCPLPMLSSISLLHCICQLLQTPRHNTVKPTVLGNGGRYTINCSSSDLARALLLLVIILWNKIKIGCNQALRHQITQQCEIRNCCVHIITEKWLDWNTMFISSRRCIITRCWIVNVKMPGMLCALQHSSGYKFNKCTTASHHSYIKPGQLGLSEYNVIWM